MRARGCARACQSSVPAILGTYELRFIGSRASDLGFRVWGFGFRLQHGFEFRLYGFGFKVKGLELSVYGVGFIGLRA